MKIKTQAGLISATGANPGSIVSAPHGGDGGHPELVGKYPKDGDLYKPLMKPDENLVEV